TVAAAHDLADVVAVGVQHVGEVVRGGDGEGVDDARAGQPVQVPAQPGGAPHRVVEADHRQVQRLAVEAAAQHHGVGADLGGDVGDHPVVGGGGGGQHRDVGAEVGDEGADTAIVGPEVVTPVRDAVRLVDHHEPGVGGQPG